jgi:hypothetical protein
VFVILGTSGGLEWEVERLRDWGLLGKTLFLVPPRKVRDTNALLEGLDRLVGTDLVATCSENNILVPALCGVRIPDKGAPVFYLTNGRDWASYFGATVSFTEELRGAYVPPAPGEIADLLDL